MIDIISEYMVINPSTIQKGNLYNHDCQAVDLVGLARRYAEATP